MCTHVRVHVQETFSMFDTGRAHAVSDIPRFLCTHTQSTRTCIHVLHIGEIVFEKHIATHAGGISVYYLYALIESG